MKGLVDRSLFLILAPGFFGSCSDMGKKLEEKLNEPDSRAEGLDSIVNREVDRVRDLDSLVNFENVKIKKLDSVITESTSRIDSIARKKIEALNEIIKQK